MVYDKQTGILTYNDRQIQAIRLNGKPFFDGDMQTALQRLPTFYIDKINIYQSHNNNGSENLFVLDLKTKAIFNGVYLNSIEGGYGSNDKQCMKIQTNYFQKKMELIYHSMEKEVIKIYMINMMEICLIKLELMVISK